jgi:LAO/AO transport system kinase
LDALSSGVLKGDRISISKAITSIENRDKASRGLLKAIYPHTGRGFIVGITGPPGTGKSSLVSALAKAYRSRGSKVAILAVDPTSPVSGGAILGDRVRMLEHALDAGVYIRSMASRGDEGGLSRAARNAIRVLDAGGFDLILVETVGIGQAEVEIVGVAEIVIVVLMPELGDEVQAVKAGLMEIADIFAVNKSDLPGADKVIYNLHSVLGIRDTWQQTALKVSAKTGQGIPELVAMIEKFRSFSRSESGRRRKVASISNELMRNVAANLAESAEKELGRDANFKAVVRRVADRKVDPETATESLVNRCLCKMRPKDEISSKPKTKADAK